MTSPSQPALWWEAARPKTLWAAVSPVMIGVALAFSNGHLHPLAASLALLGAILIQIGTNFHNDLADFKKGADTEHRKGPRRMVQAGLISESTMRLATRLVFGLAVLSGMYLMVRGGWPVVMIGFSSILFGLAYTGGRYSLAYLGIADGFVLLFFGPVAVAGTYYVQALSWPESVWVAGLAPGLLAVAILLVNNIRDRVQDDAAGKKTLIVRLGRGAGEVLYLGCMIGACSVSAVLWFAYEPGPWVLLSLFTLPLMIQTFFRLKSIPDAESERMNPVLGLTARNLFVFSFLFSLGLVVDSVW